MNLKNLKPGGFVAAGLPAIRQHLKTVLKNQPEYLTESGLNKFLLDNCNKVLSSVGIALEKKKLDDPNVFKRYQKAFDRFKNTEFLNDCELILDSAGYQYQCGLIPKHFVKDFIDMYHQFLVDNDNRYSYAFLFDPVPGATKSVVESYKEMEDLNLLSYNKAAKLPESVRKKILYIHHFRTPKINKLYKELLFEHKLADNFENFSTGGLVSFLLVNFGNRLGRTFLIHTTRLLFITCIFHEKLCLSKYRTTLVLDYLHMYFVPYGLSFGHDITVFFL